MREAEGNLDGQLEGKAWDSLRNNLTPVFVIESRSMHIKNITSSKPKVTLNQKLKCLLKDIFPLNIKGSCSKTLHLTTISGSESFRPPIGDDIHICVLVFFESVYLLF